MRCLQLTLALAVVACANAAPGSTTVKLPDAAPGIGFDDLRYSSTLQRVLVPAGRSGRLDLIEPQTLAVTSITGFSATSAYSGGHDDGPTSVEEAVGKLYVTDRTARTLVTVDITSAAIAGSIALGSEPDYVRFVPTTNELWVSEPSSSQIEIFKMGDDGTPVPDSTLAVENGPESLVVDAEHGRAYTHRWQASTVAIDVATRSIVAEWPNGCASSRGIALDAQRGWLFAACSEGTVTVLDVSNHGRILSSLARGSGFDVVGYNQALGHLYLAGSACSCLVIVGVTPSGELTFLDRFSAPGSTHCAAADDLGHAWVCDPDRGELLRVDDHHAGTL